VPGAAVSPGRRSCNFTNADPLTVIEDLVVAVGAPEASLAVSVRVPLGLKVKLDSAPEHESNVSLPAVPPLSSAIVAFASEVVMFTFGVALATTFQFASTALTTMPPVMAVPAVCAAGEPVLPVAVPGAAVSPGRRICNLVT